MSLRATLTAVGRIKGLAVSIKIFQKVLDKLNDLRYYIKADSHSGLTKSLQSFYKPLMIERQCSLKTKQCNKKSCTHDFKPDVGFCVRHADAGYK